MRSLVSTSAQERIIERLKEQRDRDDRERTEELDCTKKELKELKERLSLLQGDLSDREVRNSCSSTSSHNDRQTFVYVFFFFFYLFLNWKLASGFPLVPFPMSHRCLYSM